MKSIISFLSASMIAIACSLTLHSCNESSASYDSTEMAERENDKKFETMEGERNAHLVEKSVEYTYAIIELSKLAEKKAMHQEVKNIAKDIENEHEMILTDLKGVAKKEGITIADHQSEEAQSHINELSEMDAAKFDKKYIDKMIDKYKKGIEALEHAIHNNDIHELEKEWAKRTLPGLNARLEKLEVIDKDIKA